jgi:hypothetical protein
MESAFDTRQNESLSLFYHYVLVEGVMLIGFLLLFMVVAFVVSWWLLQDKPSVFEIQLATTLMQLAVIGGLGMLAEIFFKRLETSRAKATRDDALRQEMLKRLRTFFVISSFNLAKSSVKSG